MKANINWGEKLDTLCHELNITMESLAYQTHQPVGVLKHIADGERYPTKSLLEAIALRFDVNPQWLVGDVEEPILLSKRCVRSEEKDILDRIMQLKDEMSDHDFAEKTDITVHVLRGARKEQRKLTDKEAENIAYYYNVSVDWLLCGDEGSRAFPCDMAMIHFLQTHEDVRKMISDRMGDLEEKHHGIVETIPSSMIGRLQEIIDNRALTVENISEATGTQTDVVTKYVTGTQEIPYKWIKKFCKAYSVSNKWLSTGEGRKEYLKNADTLGNGMNTAGARVRALRKELGLTQTEFASKLDVTTALIALVETGRASLTERVADRIANQYNVSKEWLMNGEE